MSFMNDPLPNNLRYFFLLLIYLNLGLIYVIKHLKFGSRSKSEEVPKVLILPRPPPIRKKSQLVNKRHQM